MQNHQSFWRVLFCTFTFSLMVMGYFVNLTYAEEVSKAEVTRKMKQAAVTFREKIARHGGYVYYQTLDGKMRYGEGVANDDQIWVQPPGTPLVGMAYLEAFHATKDPWYLEAATETGIALIYGQLKSGGWAHYIDFNPKGKLVMLYRNGKGQGKNYSTLDDNSSQSALLFLIKLDKAHDFKHAEVHEAVTLGLNSLLAAQFPNGAFSQVWEKAAPNLPVIKASYPAYDPINENRTKEYWFHYTLNDGLAGDVIRVLIEADQTYRDQKYVSALKKLGDFLILAQMPDPQPAWAQQYNPEMHPAWARKFEPPAITGGESQDAIRTLITISKYTGDKKYLKPVEPALAYLKKSLLKDGQLARFYELKSNKPLYFTKEYVLTYDDSDMPTHYGFNVPAKLDELEKEYLKVKELKEPVTKQSLKKGTAGKVKEILTSLNEQNFWVSEVKNERITGQPKFGDYKEYISSQVFCNHLFELSAYLRN